MTSRTVPTGAVFNYEYQVYMSSKARPYHVELVGKTLQLAENLAVPYRWTWSRFSLTPIPGVPGHPEIPSTHGFGSNPDWVAARDPFNNLTLYRFNTSHYDSTVHADCNTRGECTNTWSDGTLASVETYAGPNPDSEHLVRRVDYQWDNDRMPDPANPDHPNPNEHMMFQYRMPQGAFFGDPSNTGNFPEYINSVAVNVRQIEEQTLVPQSAGGAGRTLTEVSSDWISGCPQARQRDEYIDGVLYRKTHTDTYLDSAKDCATHHYVQVTDATNNVISRVDRKFTNGQLQCEIRRAGSGGESNLTDCSVTRIIPAGDVETINTFDDDGDPASSTDIGRFIKTETRGGDDGSGNVRSVDFEYLDYPVGESTFKTDYLTKKEFALGLEDGLRWWAIDRDIDYTTGWTQTTRDTAGNATQYEWDTLGRLTQIIPPSPELQTFITYRSLQETWVKQSVSVDTFDDFIETRYHYDSLGRLVLTERRNAAGGYDRQATEYDIAGRATRKSEWLPGGVGVYKWTTYDFTMYHESDPVSGQEVKYPDPLGRIHGVTTPDDLTPQTPTTETSYSGNTTTVTVRDIAGWVSGSNAKVTSTTTYTKDALGRLIAVDSPTGGADARYHYDEANNLTEVDLTEPAAPTQMQLRQFEYDPLGRLRTAVNPESGTVLYNMYDARGNLLSYTDARQNTFTMVYDGADRLLTRSAGGQLLVSNTYDASGDCTSGCAKGRLVQQDSYKIENGTSTAVSTTRFGYGEPTKAPASCPGRDDDYMGLNGRLSWRKATILPWVAELETDYCENAFGLPTATLYPDVWSHKRTRTELVTTYTNGYLTKLDDVTRHDDFGRPLAYITRALYTGGVPTEIDRVGAEEYITLDSRNRPSRINSVAQVFSGPSLDGSIHIVPCSTVASDPSDYPELDATGRCGDPGGGGGNGGYPIPSRSGTRRRLLL